MLPYRAGRAATAALTALPWCAGGLPSDATFEMDNDTPSPTESSQRSAVVILKFNRVDQKNVAR